MIPSNPELPQYKILTALTFSNLEDDVNSHLEHGWQPYMSAAFHEYSRPNELIGREDFWYQALIYVPPDPVAMAQRSIMMQQLRAQGATGIVTP